MKFRVKRYFGNLLLLPWYLLDLAWNTVTGGDVRETYSSRIGRVKLANGGDVPRRRWFMRAIDKVLNWIDENHSIDAVQSGVGGDGAADRPKDIKGG